jgi:hypothetical protein
VFLDPLLQKQKKGFFLPSAAHMITATHTQKVQLNRYFADAEVAGTGIISFFYRGKITVSNDSMFFTACKLSILLNY